MPEDQMAPGAIVAEKFRLDRVVGEGGLGVVWAATHLLTHKPVALKFTKFRFPELDSAFQWQKEEKILVEISRKFDPQRLQEQLRFFGLAPVLHLTDPNEWFSVLLFKKQS